MSHALIGIQMLPLVRLPLTITMIFITKVGLNPVHTKKLVAEVSLLHHMMLMGTMVAVLVINLGIQVQE